MTTAEQVVARVCGQKRRYHDPRDARRDAEHLTRKEHVPIGWYRCPFGDDRHWHVGHVPSLHGLQQIARVIRGLPPDPEERP